MLARTWSSNAATIIQDAIVFPVALVKICAIDPNSGSENMTFAIHSFGCKVNIYESEYVINLLQKNNYKIITKLYDNCFFILCKV